MEKWKKAVVNDLDPTGPRPRGARRLLSHPRRWIAGGVVACAAIGIPVGIVASSSSAATSPSATATGSAPAGGHAGGGVPGGGSNARSGPAEGGAAGTVGSVSGSTFTLTTSTGQKVTVTETSATTDQNGTSSTSAPTDGESVLVLGTVNGTTITAAQVIEQSTSGSATQAVPFQQGAPSTAKQVGQIPANYTEGSGTIVSGTTADQATEAALAAYTGGVVDRVVQLSSGEYEVHNIGVNWPHHIFVDQNFQVVGAE